MIPRCTLPRRNKLMSMSVSGTFLFPTGVHWAPVGVGQAWSKSDPGCVKTLEARKPGEWLSQIAQIRPRSEIVIAPIAIQGEICPINFPAPAFLHGQDPKRT